MYRTFIWTVLIIIIIQTLRFTIEDIEAVRKLLAVILHLGNVEISEPKAGDETQGVAVDKKQVTSITHV